MFNENTFKKPDRYYGPLQIVHDLQFIALNLTENFDWPDDSTEEYKLNHINWRLKRLASRGYGGVVLNVAFKNYMEDEQAWERLVKTVDMAKALNLRIWIYDEQYYPSGMAGGLALRGHPELEAQALACVACDVELPHAPVRIASPCGHSSLKFAFAVPYNVNMQQLYLQLDLDPESKKGKLDFANQIDISRYTDTGGGLCWDCPGGSWRVYCFFTRAQYEGSYLCRTIRSPHRVVNCCDEQAVRRFLDITYDSYKKWLGNRLYEDIEAVFADEPGLLGYTPYPKDFDPASIRYPSESIFEIPNLDIPIYPFIHWSNKMEEKFREYTGYELKEHLPRLFEGGEDFNSLRKDYYTMVGLMFDSAYSQQYKNYMKEFNIAYSGHLRSIGHISEHPRVFGDILHTLGQMDIPGCDHLDSNPATYRYMVDCKLASSASHLYGKRYTMVEASHMYNTKEPLTLDFLLCSTASYFAQGINLVTSYYGENVLTEDEYAIFSMFTARLGTLFEGGIHQSQALLYYPYLQIAASLPVMNSDTSSDKTIKIANSLTDITKRLLMRQIDFDYINNEKLAECKIVDDRIITPNGESPSMIIFPEIDFIGPDISKFIGEAVNAGVFVGFAGRERKIRGLENCEGVKFFEDDLEICSKDLLTDRPCLGLLCMHKRFGGQELYLVVNTEPEELSIEVCITKVNGSIKQLNLVTGDTFMVDSRVSNGQLHFELRLGKCQAAVLCVE